LRKRPGLEARVHQLGRERDAIGGFFVELSKSALCEMNCGETFIAAKLVF
jgi:hypothetical protein